ncbi:hypothetical protein FB451DRAFT_1369175 [Mycena latifolia]|nr:hypothetical protein FB451DRAFT_1369175 [Mycena latifolia]
MDGNVHGLLQVLRILPAACFTLDTDFYFAGTINPARSFHATSCTSTTTMAFADNPSLIHPAIYLHDFGSAHCTSSHALAFNLSGLLGTFNSSCSSHFQLTLGLDESMQPLKSLVRFAKFKLKPCIDSSYMNPSRLELRLQAQPYSTIILVIVALATRDPRSSFGCLMATISAGRNALIARQLQLGKFKSTCSLPTIQHLASLTREFAPQHSVEFNQVRASVRLSRWKPAAVDLNWLEYLAVQQGLVPLGRSGRNEKLAKRGLGRVPEMEYARRASRARELENAPNARVPAPRSAGTKAGSARDARAIYPADSAAGAAGVPARAPCPVPRARTPHPPPPHASSARSRAQGQRKPHMPRKATNTREKEGGGRRPFRTTPAHRKLLLLLLRLSRAGAIPVGCSRPRPPPSRARSGSPCCRRRSRKNPGRSRPATASLVRLRARAHRIPTPSAASLPPPRCHRQMRAIPARHAPAPASRAAVAEASSAHPADLRSLTQPLLLRTPRTEAYIRDSASYAPGQSSRIARNGHRGRVDLGRATSADAEEVAVGGGEE